MIFRHTKTPTTLLIGIIFYAYWSAAEAQEDVNVINWYYSTMFGTGFYTVGDAKVGIVRVPVSYSFKTIVEKKDSYGLRLLAPISMGFHSFEFNEIFDLPNNVATLSFVPGLELEYIIKDAWVLLPYVNLGIGQEFSQNINSWIYGAGIKSRWILPFNEGEFTLGNAVQYAGYSASDGDRRATLALVAGLNWITPLNFTLFNRNTNFGTHLIYYGYPNELDFVAEDTQSFSIRHEFEFALTFGTHKPRSFLGFDFTRLGLGFRVGKDLRAIRLVTDFPF